MLLIQPQTNRLGEQLDFALQNSLGFELIDFYFPNVLDDQDTVDRLMEIYSETPVKSFHGPFIDINYSGGDPQIFEVSKKRIEQCAFLAYKMNVKKIILHSCFFPIMPPSDPLYRIWAEESAHLLIGIAEKYDVQFCIENVLDVTPDIILLMMTEASHPRIRVCLDIGHAHLTRTPLSEWVGRLAPYITHVHLCGNHGLYDDHIAVGDGSIDFSEADRLFQKHNVNADYTIETKPFENTKKSLEFLNSGGMPYVKS